MIPIIIGKTIFILYPINCSTTQNSDPCINAVAERLNGILKQVFSIDNFN